MKSPSSKLLEVVSSGTAFFVYWAEFCEGRLTFNHDFLVDYHHTL